MMKKSYKYYNKRITTRDNGNVQFHFFSITMCRTKTKVKQNIYNSALTTILRDDGEK